MIGQSGDIRLGIDLGTTYSVVATLDSDGEAVVLPNSLGELTTPSVVTFAEPGSVLVGATAKQAAVAMPDRTVSLIKRHMGTDHPLYFDEVEHTPESISALILRGLLAGVVGREVEVSAVVTVPAYFGVREREATQQACVLAGIDVLELLSEPVAAAIHYGFDGAAAGNFLIHDLGGGTFDTTVLRVMHGRTTVVATDGDTELGGADWDGRLAEHLRAEFVRQSGAVDDPADDEAFMADLLLLAERTKRELTGAESRVVRLRHAGHSIPVSVTRREFEATCDDLRERTHAYVRRVLSAAAAKGVTEIDRALLVGGSSRMPMIASSLSESFGWPVELRDPDFAVAKGAAVRAAAHGARRTHGDAGRDDARRAGWEGAGHALTADDIGALAPVVARGFGLLVHDSHEPSGSRTVVQHIIHQNDPLPVRGRDLTVATIMTNQGSVRLEVFEQAGAVESAEPADNRRVLDGQLTGLPPSPAGSPIRICFHLSVDGRLQVTAVDVASGRTLQLEAYVDGVLDTATRDQLASAITALKVTQ